MHKSLTDFNANIVTVKVAKRMNKVKIVSASWLEDSLVARSRLPKPEGPYLLVESRKKGKGKNLKRKQAEAKEQESSGNLFRFETFSYRDTYTIDLEKTAPQKRTTRIQDVIAEMGTGEL